VSSSNVVSRSLTADSGGKLVLSLKSGLVIINEDPMAGDGVDGVRDVDGMGEDVDDLGVAIDWTRRDGGVGVSTPEGGLSRHRSSIRVVSCRREVDMMPCPDSLEGEAAQSRSLRYCVRTRLLRGSVPCNWPQEFCTELEHDNRPPCETQPIPHASDRGCNRKDGEAGRRSERLREWACMELESSIFK